ncbi:MAG: glycosyltransferase [Planctomycetota bacterium]
MRLLVNATSYGAEPGGAGVRALHLYGALAQHDVVFLLAEDTSREVVPAGVETRVLPVRAGNRLQRFLQLRLPEDGDLLLTDHYPVATIPTVLTLHDRGGPAWRRALVRRQIARADAVVSVSETVRAAWGGSGEVVANGADPMDDPPAPEDHLLVCDPGLPHKRVDRARAVAAALDRPLRERGRGVGWMRHEEMRREIARARVVLCPSEKEGFGRVALEAMALGRPLVASDIPAHREVAGDYARYAGTPEEWIAQVRAAWDETKVPAAVASWADQAARLEPILRRACTSRTAGRRR